MISKKWILGVLIFSVGLLSSCTAILDFSAPVEPANTDAGDAKSQKDATLPADAASLASCSLYEPNDKTETAKVIAKDVTIHAGLCKNGTDTDFYSYSFEKTETVTIRLTFTKQGTEDLDLNLLDAAGNIVITSKGTGAEEVIVHELPAGVAYFQVIAQENTPDIDYSLSFTFEQ